MEDKNLLEKIWYAKNSTTSVQAGTENIFQEKFPLSRAYFSVPRHENITRKVTSIISRPFIQDEQRHEP